MCGIAGYLGPLEIAPETATRCLHAMWHRGPDSRGSIKFSVCPGWNLILLHTRLSIIDLDQRARQPFRCGRHTLVFNGEIYNYLELKNVLSAAGCQFKTRSDTEILVQALNTFGIDALDEFEGMWAFAAYNDKDKSLLLSRDRFGEKPLYLYQNGVGLYFGSEIKFLRILTGRKLPVNHRHITRFLVNGYKSLYKETDTFFEGISELPPGSYLKQTPGKKTQIIPYWTPRYEPDHSMSYPEAVEGARSALMESVKLRLRADVPMAFCMSGGVDSNALISIARKVLDVDVHGFTIVNTDERYDEQKTVDQAVSDLNIRHTSVELNKSEFLSKLRMLVIQHDAPVYTVIHYVHWLLMVSIAQYGYRISISGVGADELFTGYYDHHNLYLNEIREDRTNFESALESWKQHLEPIVRNPVLKNPLCFVQNPRERSHIYLNAAKFRNYLKTDFQEAFHESRFCDSPLRNRMLNEMFAEAVPVILHEDDLNAMSCSIENRSPFLDRRLFEFCNRIPSRHLIQHGYGKSVLRDAVRGIAPDCIVNNRRKVGFNAPVLELLDVADQNVRAAILDDSPIFNWIHRHKIEKLVNRRELLNSESKFLFYFLGCKMFLEEFDR